MIERLGAGLAGLRVVGQKNQGQAVARNVGMRHAAGSYLAFVDADDVLDARMYATLVGLAENEQLDIAMGNAWNFYEGRKPDHAGVSRRLRHGVITGETWFQQRWLCPLPAPLLLDARSTGARSSTGTGFRFRSPIPTRTWSG